MQPGDLDERITFERKQETQGSGSGAYRHGWTDHATVWASVTEETRPERVGDGVSLASRPANIFIHWRYDITSEMRVRYGERTLKIVAGPAEVGRREWLKFSAVEFSTQGDAP
jgi:SPP1 family predicted phage head-tail adaptor